MSRSKTGDAGALLLVGALVGPHVLGYFVPWFAFALVALFVVWVWWTFAQADRGAPPGWIVRHPYLSVGAFLWLAVGVGSGILHRQRSDADAVRYAADEAARLREQAAYVAREETARQARERAAREQVEAARLAEARRTPAERASRAEQFLSDPAKGLHERVCGARRELASIPAEAQGSADVRAVQRRLRGAEREDLRELRAAAAPRRHLLCCDGRLSPTCACSRSNRRGCCSHHGGICGCEPLPDRVVCPGE